MSEMLTIGGPAVAVIFALAVCAIALLKYGIMPSMRAFADLAATQREATVRAQEATECAREAAQSAKIAAERASEAACTCERLVERMSAGRAL